MPDGRRYLEALRRHLRENPTEPGTVAHAEIRHDEDCERPDGGPCTCTPEIVTGSLVDRKYGGAR